jgi:hypothetical protein
MGREHVVDLRRAATPVDSVDDAFAFHEDERRRGRHSETLGELRLLLDVHALLQTGRANYTRFPMGSWYWIGVCAGLGVAAGVLLAGFLTGTRAAVTAAVVLAAGAGVGIGFALGQWGEAVGGGLGGAFGSIGAAQLVSGTLRRGGSRLGTAIFIAVAAVVLAGVAWIPIAGYLEATFVPALAGRLRGRAGERYAGLRSLAKD